MLSGFDAVYISAEQVDKMRWSSAPAAPLDSQENVLVTLRVREAKYPTGLLANKGGFPTWFSPESRSLTVGLLHEALESMQLAMNHLDHVIEDYVRSLMAFRSI